MPLGRVLRSESAGDIQTMSRHLPRLQIEEAEMLADMIAQRITRSAIEILKVVGILQDRPEPAEDSEDLTPEEVAILRMAEEQLHSDPFRR